MAPKETLNWLYEELSKAASKPINEDSLLLKTRTWVDKLASVLRGLKNQPEWKNEDLKELNGQVSQFHGRVMARYNRFPQDAASRERLLNEWRVTINEIKDETRKTIILRGYA